MLFCTLSHLSHGHWRFDTTQRAGDYFRSVWGCFTNPFFLSFNFHMTTKRFMSLQREQNKCIMRKPLRFLIKILQENCCVSNVGSGKHPLTLGTTKVSLLSGHPLTPCSLHGCALFLQLHMHPPLLVSWLIHTTVPFYGPQAPWQQCQCLVFF